MYKQMTPVQRIEYVLEQYSDEKQMHEEQIAKLEGWLSEPCWMRNLYEKLLDIHKVSLRFVNEEIHRHTLSLEHLTTVASMHTLTHIKKENN